MEPSKLSQEPDDWDEIHGFQSPGEFHRFTHWIDDALQDGALAEVPVSDRYSDADVFIERWFRARSGRVWRLVEPDPPFRGAFLVVDS